MTLKKSASERLCFSDVLVLLILPAVMALVLANFFDLTNDLVNGVVTAASIFAGLLLNLLVLVYTVLSRQRANPSSKLESDKRKIFNDILNETFANISFCILISVVLVVACLLYYIKGGVFPFGNRYLIYFLIFELIVTLLMILKRIHNLFEHEISNDVK